MAETRKPRLSQVVGTLTEVKTRVNKVTKDAHRAASKAEVLTGFHKNYRPNDEQGERLPDESKRVQHQYADLIAEFRQAMIELFDDTATVDWGNTQAKADVVVDGKALLRDVPSTHLMFLAKQLEFVRTFLTEFVELDPNFEWTPDPNSGLNRSAPVSNAKTAKVQEPLVLYPATEKHPAQTQLITRDVIVGYWSKTELSGAIPAQLKKKLLERVQKLTRAVEFALKEANSLQVEEKRTGAAVFEYLFD